MKNITIKDIRELKKEEIHCRYKKLDKDYYIKTIKDITELFYSFINKKNHKKDDFIINIVALMDIITRMDKRDEYFQYFHGSEINEFKHTALLVYWINKLRPFMCKSDCLQTYYDEQSSDGTVCLNGFNDYINEKFSMFLILGIIKKFAPKYLGVESNRPEYINKFINEMEYSLRFRDISKEALILMLEPFYLSGIASENGNN